MTIRTQWLECPECGETFPIEISGESLEHEIVTLQTQSFSCRSCGWTDTAGEGELMETGHTYMRFTPREALVLHWWLEALTDTEIARRLSARHDYRITRARVQQIKEKILRKVKGYRASDLMERGIIKLGDK